MRNIKIILEYDGTDFRGWQKQEGRRTIQGTLEEALGMVLGKGVSVHGAGRTDAGVHAWGQVCHFLCETRLSAQRLARAASACLPEDIRIREADEVDLDFHARFSAVSRKYAYYVRTEPTALWRRYFYIAKHQFDVKAMKTAAWHLMGEKDFASFTPERSIEGSTVCRVLGLEIVRTGKVLSIAVESDRFLHKMVRTMVGTLLEVGRGKIPPEQVKEILGKKKRSSAGPTLPPNGLFLLGVRYDS